MPPRKGELMAWRRNNTKYNAKKVTMDGFTFDSKLEAKRYIQLKLMLEHGEIRNLSMQVKFELIPAQYDESKELYTRGEKKGQPKKGKLLEKACTYIADFVYYDNISNRWIVEDTKGMLTPEYVIKRKLMLWIHGIRINEVHAKKEGKK